uniref:Uncharacterized protein n=1 Tax=Nelumbo nucifera TaxID=4432 RepID=A0A822ZII8_NELNU|nr:TPA_asm: hypothetical protein HUJ06_001056 [Nelumbo nucifera]
MLGLLGKNGQECMRKNGQLRPKFQLISLAENENQHPQASESVKTTDQ